MRISGTAIGLSVVGLIILGIVAWFTPWVHLDNSPKPLGNKLEYIGKFDYGCGGFIGVCDAAPGATYYYSTDMNTEQAIAYFQKAKLKQPPQQEGRSILIWMQNTKSKKEFTFNYYRAGDDNELTHLELKDTTKHVIRLDYKDYSNARDSIQ